MQGLALVQVIGIMIVAAAAVVTVARWLNMPTIVAYIITGLMLAPVMTVLALGAPEEDHTVEIIAEVGIALLLFLVGLELSLEKIRDVGKVALFAGIGQVVFTAVLGFLLALMLGFTVMESVFLATVLTFSSTVVVVKLLDQKKELDTLYGRIAVGILLVQDLIVIIVLTFLAGIGSEESLKPAAMALNLAKAFGGMALLLVAALLAVRYLLVRPFAWAAQSPPTLFVWSLCWCFLFVQVAAFMELSQEIGAFLAGMSLAQLHCSHELRRRVHPLMNFFIVIFFITLGAQMQVSEAVKLWPSAVAFSLFVLVVKPPIFMWMTASNGYSERTSFFTSVTLAQISEFSFIFAAAGVSTGLIGGPVLSVITLVGLITIAVSSYMILYNHGLYALVSHMGLLKIFKAKTEPEDEHAGTDRLVDHIIIVGMNAMGRRLADLHDRGEKVLAVDTDTRKLRNLPCRTLVGDMDHQSVLEEAGLERAKLAVSTLQIEDANNLLAYRCAQVHVPVAIHAFDRSVFKDLRRLGVDYLIDSRSAGRDKLTHTLHRAGVIEA